ncbi:MAG: hypothetical protein IJR64_05370 [Bacteroidales bacterium]|nr:hypothetical protein [Bacteroidales bacterium]
MIDDKYIQEHTLFECFEAFKGAQGNNKDERLEYVTKEFKSLAKKLLYGGHLLCDKYEITIQVVEFYYHEEETIDVQDRILDPIVYHRNGRYPGEPVPPFPIMSTHAHPSGYDITFEDHPKGKYRASALIRAYTVKDRDIDKYIRWNPKDNGNGENESSDDPLYDDRSQNLYYFLNGFQVNGNGHQIEWKDYKDFNPEDIYQGHRKNVFMVDEKKFLEDKKSEFKVDKNSNLVLDEKEWAFSKKENREIKHSRSETKHSNSFSMKETYYLVTSE